MGLENGGEPEREFTALNNLLNRDKYNFKLRL